MQPDLFVERYSILHIVHQEFIEIFLDFLIKFTAHFISAFKLIIDRPYWAFQLSCKLSVAQSFHTACSDNVKGGVKYHIFRNFDFCRHFVHFPFLYQLILYRQIQYLSRLFLISLLFYYNQNFLRPAKESFSFYRLAFFVCRLHPEGVRVANEKRELFD